MFDAMLQVLKVYPGNEMVLTACLVLVELCQSALPSEPFPVMSTLQNVVLSVPSTITQGPTLYALSLQFIHALWATYKEKLSASCDVDGLAEVLNKALDVENSQTRAIAFEVVGDTLKNLINYLSDQQVQKLSEKGVYRHLRAVVKHYNEMNAVTLRKAMLNIYIFTCLSPCTEELLAEGFVSTLLSASEKIWSEDAMQECICRILAVSSKSRGFLQELLNQNFLLRVAKLLQQDCYHSSLFKFLLASFGFFPDLFPQRCIEDDEFMRIILEIDIPTSKTGKEDAGNMCKLLTLLCTIDSPKLFEYKLVKKIEEYATNWPLEVVWVCRALTVVAESLCQSKKFQNELERLQNSNSSEPPVIDQTTLTRAIRFFEENHHLFLQQMLSDPELCADPDLLNAFYGTLLNIAIVSPQDAIGRMCSQDFIEFLMLTFIRDTTTFPELASSIVNCMHVLLLRVSCKEELIAFCKADFHAAVLNLLEQAATDNIRNVAANLLRFIAVQYNKILKSVKVLLECQVPKVVVNILKACRCKDDEESTYVSNLLSLLLTISGDKVVSQELYKAGFLDSVLELVQMGCSTYAYGMLALILGSLVFPEYARQLHLTDRKFHLTLLQAMKDGANTSPLDVHLLYSCIVTLTILACNDFVKDELVAGGCMETVTSILQLSEDNVDVCSICLGLLCTLLSSPLVQKQPSIVHAVLSTVASTLKGSKGTHDRVKRAAASIILSCQEEDHMLMEIEEVGVIERLLETAGQQCKEVRTRQCCSMVIDRQLLNVIPFNSKTQDVVVLDTTQTRPQAPQSDQSLTPNIPKAPELDDTSRQKLTSLGIDLSEPILRIGRVYGVHIGECHSCERGEWFEEIGIRPQGLTHDQYQRLIDKGWFRRGGVKLYHSSRCHDVQCTYWETKVSVHEFDYRSHKTYVKVIKRMPVDRISIETRPAHFSQEAYDLYNKYNIGRHAKSLVMEKEYCEHVVDSPILNESFSGVEYGSFHQLYRLDGKLVAVGLIDIVPKGIVSLYMWYSLDKEVSKYSLGVYSALKEIEMVRELSKKNPEMKYYYIQGWAEGNSKLAYKAKYTPEEFYSACVIPEWVPSLKAVKEAKEKLISEQKNGFPSMKPIASIAEETTVKNKKVATDVPCSAFEKDRAKYEQLTGHKPDVSKIVVCLNGTEYLHLGDVFTLFDMRKSQKGLIEERFEEILVAMDPGLTRNMVVDLKTSTH